MGLVASYFNSPYFKGMAGERFVDKKLFKELDPEKYIILHNLLLPTETESLTTQIDHLVISTFGIFCIETKSYGGWIFGRATDKYWTQTFYKNKTRFYNPLRQNYAHIKAIEALINPLLLNINIYSFIAFPEAEKLNITGTEAVGYTRDIIKKIKGYDREAISKENLDKILAIIVKNNIADKKELKNHNERVSKKNKNLFYKAKNKKSSNYFNDFNNALYETDDDDNDVFD